MIKISESFKQTASGPGALRLILALAVFLHHISSAGIGPAAVYVFFALSGFWIHRMWTTRYSQSSTPLTTYYISRAWRLSPIFWLASVITAVGYLVIRHPMNWTPAAIISSVAILGYSSLPVRPIGPAWSLDIEMQFYLVAPVLVWLARRWPAASLLVASAAISVASVVLHTPSFLTPYLFFFSTGILAAQTNWRPSRLAVSAPLAVIAGATAALLLSPWRSVVVGGAHPGPWFHLNPIYNVVLGLAVIPYAISTTGRRGGRFDGMFADLSYTVYLFHWIAAQWLGAVGAGHPALYRLPFAAIALAGTLGASWLAWILYDRPINRLRARWVRDRIAPQTGALIAEPAAP